MSTKKLKKTQADKSICEVHNLNVLDTSALIDLFRGSEAAKSFIDDEAVTTTR
jgi:hypothetical protein